MTFIYLHGIKDKHVGTSLSWRDKMLQFAGTSAAFGAETVCVTYRSHCSEPAAVRRASPFIFTAAVSARTDCPSVRTSDFPTPISMFSHLW